MYSHTLNWLVCELRFEVMLSIGSVTSLLSLLTVGILPLLYALLLHDGPPRHSTIPPVLPSHLLSIATAGVKAINNMAILALKVVQVSE